MPAESAPEDAPLTREALEERAEAFLAGPLSTAGFRPAGPARQQLRERLVVLLDQVARDAASTVPSERRSGRYRDNPDYYRAYQRDRRRCRREGVTMDELRARGDAEHPRFRQR